MNQSGKNSGFVLIMTLAVVMIAGVVMAGVARRSMIGAVQVQSYTEQLQRRWAFISCRDVLLANADRVLECAELGIDLNSFGNGEAQELEYKNDPVAELRVNCTLAEKRYELIFTDEKARLNVNAIADIKNKIKIKSAIKQLVSDSAFNMRNITVNVRPQLMEIADKKSERKIGTFGQVFDNVSPELLISEGDEIALSQLFTCWGDGKINIRRASDLVLSQACRKELGSDITGQLIDLRQQNPYRKLASIVADIKITGQKRKERITDFLSDESDCYGLWVIAHAQQRRWYSFSVGEKVTVKKSDDSVNESAHIGLTREFRW